MIIASLSTAVILASNPVQPIELSPAQAARSVLLLHAPATSGQALGTGFLVNLNGRLFLVTAAHVASAMREGAQVTYGGTDDVATSVPLASVVRAKPVTWTVHAGADVAAVELSSSSGGGFLLARALPPSVFISKVEAPERARPLTTIGYPLGLGGLRLGPDKRISPISRESRVSSGLITLPRFDTKQPVVFFLLDNPSIGGFSGAPVFMLPGAFSQGAGIAFSGASFCVGIVHGTISDETGGKLAAVVPVGFVTQTLERAYANAR